jgi:hypothetical protein
VYDTVFFYLGDRREGNETVSSADILSALDDMGIGIGSFGPSIVNEQVSNEILQVIPELSFSPSMCMAAMQM